MELTAFAVKSFNGNNKSEVWKPNLGNAENFGTEMGADACCQGSGLVLSSIAFSDLRVNFGQRGLNLPSGGKGKE